MNVSYPWTTTAHQESVISAGGAPAGDAIGFRYWNEEPFRNGFKGFLDVLSTCVFAMSGSESVGLAAAESANPRKSVPNAVKSIFLRLSFFYILGSLAVSITVSPTDPNLFGSVSLDTVESLVDVWTNRLIVTGHQRLTIRIGIREQRP